MFQVYLAGPITGCTFEGCTDWREELKNQLLDCGVHCLSPMRGKEYLKSVGEISGSYPDLGPLASDRGIMTRDHNDCVKADLVVFNLLGAKIVSIGTMMELAWAWDRGIPTIVAMEPTDNVHEHPMVREAIGFRVTSIEQLYHHVRAILDV